MYLNDCTTAAPSCSNILSYPVTITAASDIPSTSTAYQATGNFFLNILPLYVFVQ